MQVGAKGTATVGAVAGAASALVFTGVHHLLISDIWFSVIPMTMAGAACGSSVAWSYGLLFPTPTVRSWMGYNGIYLFALGLLGVTSIAVFEPVTTVAALVEANVPPTALFVRALPMTAGFVVAMTVVLGRCLGRGWRHYAAIFVTSTLLVGLLGLNVSAIGLVYVPRSSAYLIAELFALIILLDTVYAIGVLMLARRTMTGVAPSGS